MLQFFGAIIAAATVSIAFFQWRTAQQKVVIDLFDELCSLHADRSENALVVAVKFEAASHGTFEPAPFDLAQKLATSVAGAMQDADPVFKE